MEQESLFKMETLEESVASTPEMSTESKLVNAQHSVEDVFGFKSSMLLNGFAPGHPLVPKPLDSFIWNKSTARDLIGWLQSPNRNPLMVYGPTGSGKTASFVQLFAKLHIPLFMVVGNSGTDPDEILGSVELQNGCTVYKPSKLVEAYRSGYAILVDEIDSFRPETVVTLHRLLEREPFQLKSGEVVHPAPNQWIVATANTRGDGQGGDIYTGTNILNLASLNRFEKMVQGYPPAVEEEQLLSARFGSNLDAKIVSAMVKTANDVRTSFAQGSCPAPISIRNMIMWGDKLVSCWNRSDVSPIYHSFDIAFGNGVDPHVRQMVHTLIHSNFGGSPPPTVAGV
jgi:cobaltochelatase CobS